MCRLQNGGIWITLLFLLSCGTTNSDGVVEIKEVVLSGDTEYKEVTEHLSEEPQVFQLNLNRDTTIECLNGTIISFPKNCFINDKGEFVTENVRVEVVEALTLSDFLCYDLQTISGDDVLESAGMMYINAIANGKQLGIAKNSSLNIELPSNHNTSDFKIFNGRYDELGNIDWTESNSIDDRMVPLPLDEMDMKFYTAYMFTDVVDMIKYTDSVVINDAKYENTYIATEEFEQRFFALWPDFFQYWEGFRDYIKNPTSAAWEEFMTPDNISKKIICEPLNIYLNNIDKPLWYSDSLVHSYLLEVHIEDSIAYWSSDLTHKDDLNSNFGYYNMFYFERCKNQRLTQPAILDNKGVDMSKSNAKELLINLGYSEREAYEQVLLYNRVQRKLEARREKKRIALEQMENQQKINKAFMLAFEVNQLGWVNVDRFLNDETAEEVVFNVDIVSNPADYCDLTLIIPSRNIAINGMRDVDGNYSFTNKGGVYRKLPVGERAIVICISSKNSQPNFYMENLIISKEQNLEIKLEVTSWDEIEQELAEMDNPKNVEG